MAGKRKTNSTTKNRRRSGSDWAADFLECLAKTSNITAACEVTGVSRTAFYFRRDSDDEFALAVRQAIDASIDILELEARRRALHGCERPVFGSGGPGQGTVQVGTVTEYSDTLTIFLLKAHRPEKYRERYEVKHGGEIAHRRDVDIKDLTLEELREYEAFLRSIQDKRQAAALDRRSAAADLQSRPV